MKEETARSGKAMERKSHGKEERQSIKYALIAGNDSDMGICAMKMAWRKDGA